MCGKFYAKASPVGLFCIYFLQVKSLKHKCVTSIGVGRYHTAVCTSTEVYTVGKNLGQLGFDKQHETTSCAPRVVSES